MHEAVILHKLRALGAFSTAWTSQHKENDGFLIRALFFYHLLIINSALLGIKLHRVVVLRDQFWGRQCLFQLSNRLPVGFYLQFSAQEPYEDCEHSV